MFYKIEENFLKLYICSISIRLYNIYKWANTFEIIF